MNETWWVDGSDLDPEQTDILISDERASILVIGPPGSGKTNILMLRANYVRGVNPRQRFITFTRALSEHLRSGPNVGRADQIQRDEISTFMSWAKSVIRNHGDALPEASQNFEEDRRAVLAALEQTITRHKINKLYDVVFVDEVQDFWEDELQALASVSKRMNFAGDARQRIWTTREGLVKAEVLASQTYEIKKHYRIGEKICIYADQILPPKVGQSPLIEGCNYRESARPSSVDGVSCKNEEEVISACIVKLKEQLRYITEEPIGVIAPHNDILDRFFEAAQDDPDLSQITIRQSSSSYQAYDEDSRVRVMTVHSSKGSEFRAVHLLGGEEFHDGNRELAFTAVTRAKTEVFVYHTKVLKGHMTPSLRPLPTDISSIF